MLVRNHHEQFFYDFVTRWHAPGSHPRRFLRSLLATLGGRAFNKRNYTAGEDETVALASIFMSVLSLAPCCLFLS